MTAQIKVIYASQGIKTLETRRCTCYAVKCRITGTTISLKLEARHKAVFLVTRQLDEFCLSSFFFATPPTERRICLTILRLRRGVNRSFFGDCSEIARHCLMGAEIKGQATHKLGLTS